MIRVPLPFAALFALGTLAACSDDADPVPPVEQVSPSEAEALDAAAAMIEQRRLPAGVLPGEESPQPDGTGALPAGAEAEETGGPKSMELPDE